MSALEARSRRQIVAVRPDARYRWVIRVIHVLQLISRRRSDLRLLVVSFGLAGGARDRRLRAPRGLVTAIARSTGMNRSACLELGVGAPRR